MDEQFNVRVTRDTKSNSISSHRNVHKVEVLLGGTLAIQVEKESMVYLAHGTWETCRVDKV
jgi:hypothetical protein